MKFRDTSCCAWVEISMLSTHQSPEAAMTAFCKLVFPSPEAGPRVKFKGMSAAANNLYAFYLFSAAVNTPGDKPSYLTEKGVDYGSKFAAFIRANKLGEVVESPTRPNKAFHPDHSNIVWIWAPDATAIQAWWKTQSERLAKQAADMKAVQSVQPLGVIAMQAKAKQGGGLYAVQAGAMQVPVYFAPPPADPFDDDDDDYEVPDWDDDDDDLDDDF